MHYDSNRQTGRTTRMLKQAIEAALDGAHVFVIGYNAVGAASLAPKALELLKGFSGAVVNGPFSDNKQLFIHKRGAGVIEFQSAADKDVVCLETYPYCVRGHNEQCFVDHYVWELYYAPTQRPKWTKETDYQYSNSAEGYKRLWQSLFPGSPFGVVPSYTEIVQSVANTMAKKPYMSSADGDMRDKFGGEKLP